ncbi:kazrin, periplakin interacting protein b [Megalops cyprinoides]|uniref:kazrin, periplakin interacting protein b n=1 Tax=Megalops cyprinoides TaxID=118141 RepID=UPI001864804C|nr:kazrin, periplakin interacting protein b [Megalops cyprinoides]
MLMDVDGQLPECGEGAAQSAGFGGTLHCEPSGSGTGHTAHTLGPPAASEGPGAETSQHSDHDLLWEEVQEEVSQLQAEVLLLREIKDLEESQGGVAEELSVTRLRVQLAQREQELHRTRETLQAMKDDRKRLKAENEDLLKQMQELCATLESREEQLRDFIHSYEQHRKENEDAVKALAQEKDLLEREKWDLRRENKEALECANTLHSQLQLRESRSRELEAELCTAKQSLATLTKDVPKRHSLATPTEPVVNCNQEWVIQAELPLTAAIRQSQQNLCHGQAVGRNSPSHTRQQCIVSDASAPEGDCSTSPSDISSPRHRTYSLCNSMENLEEQKSRRRERLSLGSLSRVFSRSKQGRSVDPGLLNGPDAPACYSHETSD